MAKTTRTILLSITSFLFLSVFAFAGPVPDTGQTKCYDHLGNEITCPQPGEAFYGQDGNYTINPPSYTKLDASGNDLADSAVSWVMVRDNVTGLIWEVKENKDGVKDYGNPHDAYNTYTWYDSNPETNGGDAGTPGDGTDTEDFLNALNSLNFGGFSDWRLPDREELRSVVDYGRYNPAIDTNYFPNTMSSDLLPMGDACYWSSTTHAYSTSSAWRVNFYRGAASSDWKSYSYYVRAIRSGQ